MTSKQLFTIALLCISAVAAHADPSPQGVYLGPGSCSSSNCHGDIKPRNSSNVLQNEYTTWSKHDRHSRAYLTLLNADSKKIASNLGIKDAAKEPLCLSCHATHVTQENLKGERYRLEDGVSCESCHGAASGWVKSHAEVGTSHADNLRNGLKDTVSLESRATLCVSCHYGNEEKTVNHRLYGAGHPRLSFELDTFGVLEPKHWVVDADYEKRKAPYVPMVAWLTGQAVLADETLKALASPTRSKHGTLPELSLFDCFSCHHSLAEGQWKRHSYGGKPGELKLNLPALVMLSVAVTPVEPSLGQKLSDLLSALHTQYLENGGADAISSLETLVEKEVLPFVSGLPHDIGTIRKILGAMTTFAANYQWPTFELAEQMGMGIQATIATSPVLAKAYAGEVKELFGTLRSSNTFKPERFSAAAKKLDVSVKKNRD